MSAVVEAVLLLVCDQPRLTVEHLRELFRTHSAVDGSTVIASRYAGIAGIPAVFPASQFTRLLALEGDTGARPLLRDPHFPMRVFDFADGEIDVDTPEDLAGLKGL